MIDPVDRYVGDQIRQRRSVLGLTQDDLAVALGVSYQQIQKYETAANRISASRLYQIGRRLDVGIAFFFDGFPPEAAASADAAATRLPHGGTMRATIDVAQSFSDISDPEVRAAIAGLIKTLGQRFQNSEESG